VIWLRKLITLQQIFQDLVVIGPIDVSFLGRTSLQAILFQVNDVTLFLDTMRGTPMGVGMAHLKVKWAGVELREALKNTKLANVVAGSPPVKYPLVVPGKKMWVFEKTVARPITEQLTKQQLIKQLNLGRGI
jgi:hypothetical protein